MGYNTSTVNKIALEQIKKTILPTLLKAEVKKAALFGSYVRGENTEESDIDILVDLPDGASLFDLVRLRLDLEEVLKKKVDVVEYAGLKPRIKDSILQQQVQIL